MHKIPTFRDPEEELDERDSEGEIGPAGDNGERPNKKKTDTISDLTEFVKFTPDELKEMSGNDLNAQITKEDEYLKTLKPNLNTLQDYEKKVC